MSEAEPGRVSLVVLICEEALEPLVGRDIVAGGAKGYTVSTVRGRGTRGVRDAQWLLSSNIRVEVMCREPVARALMADIERKYSKNYGLVMYMHDVLATRAEAF